MNKALYLKYGGRVIFQQAGIEPIDAYQAQLAAIKGDGGLKIIKTKYRDVFDDFDVDPDIDIRDPSDIQFDIGEIDAALELIKAAEGYDRTAESTDEYAQLLLDRAMLESELELAEALAATLAAEAEAAAVVGIAELSDEAIDALWDLLEDK